MPSLLQRMRKVTNLLQIRLGPGAAVLPNDISRLHLRFAKDSKDGHMGPRKFWKQELIRLKYHNPAIPMTIDRTCPNSDPALLTIHRISSPSDSPSSSPSDPSLSPTPISSTTSTTTSTATTTPTTSAYTPSTHTETITMTHKSSAEILAELLAVTGAKVVEATVEDRETLARLDEERKRGEESRVMSLAVRAKVKREEQLLAQARGELAG